MRPRLTKEDLSFKPSDVITFSTLNKAKRRYIESFRIFPARAGKSKRF